MLTSAFKININLRIPNLYTWDPELKLKLHVHLDMICWRISLKDKEFNHDTAYQHKFEHLNTAIQFMYKINLLIL